MTGGYTPTDITGSAELYGAPLPPIAKPWTLTRTAKPRVAFRRGAMRVSSGFDAGCPAGGPDCRGRLTLKLRRPAPTSGKMTVVSMTRKVAVTSSRLEPSGGSHSASVPRARGGCAACTQSGRSCVGRCEPAPPLRSCIARRCGSPRQRDTEPTFRQTGDVGAARTSVSHHRIEIYFCDPHAPWATRDQPRRRRRAQRPAPQAPTLRQADRRDRTTAVALTARIHRSFLATSTATQRAM